jgi:uncharacterized C2H2 Zn-finger protein
MIGRTLIAIPRLPVFIADKNLADRCPRCQRMIKESERYLEHSEGRLHEHCLRTGQTKRFIGRRIK